ncbi:hypothetical protein BsIDN1_28310 [Bacillus safensis]|uniref:Uncharacterized protein n=1 Tax=Bacillus safensis TaxID=561879 RepID=A0A5S9M7V6_BACIA|nr:hypothetical protein BsIDN1_28310 [Bacillus safensis]
MREELVEGKYLRAKQKRLAKKKKPAAIQLETYESSQGIPILVGKTTNKTSI